MTRMKHIAVGTRLSTPFLVESYILKCRNYLKACL